MTYPNISALVQSFNGPINTTAWAVGAAGATVSGGKAVFAPNTDSGMTSKGTFRLDSITVEWRKIEPSLTQGAINLLAANAAGGGNAAWVDSHNAPGFMLFVMRSYANGFKTAQLVYDPDAMRFLRFRIVEFTGGNTAFWEKSPDGKNFTTVLEATNWIDPEPYGGYQLYFNNNMYLYGINTLPWLGLNVKTPDGFVKGGVERQLRVLGPEGWREYPSTTTATVKAKQADGTWVTLMGTVSPDNAPVVAPPPQAQPPLPLTSKVIGGYWPKYFNSVSLSSIPAQYNLIYLFQAGPKGGQDGPQDGHIELYDFGGAVGDNIAGDNRWTLDQYRAGIAALHAQGTRVFLTVGGAGAWISLSSRARSTNLVNDIKQIYYEVGGFDGLDFNLETTASGFAVYPAEMAWVAEQLRWAFGSNFGISIPATGSIYAPYMQHDLDIVAALYNGRDYTGKRLLDFLSPQYYDLWNAPEDSGATNAQRATLAINNAIWWAAKVDNDWTRIGMGFATASYGMSVHAAELVWNILAGEHPTLRGVFHFDTQFDASQNWAFANILNPRVLGSLTPLPQPPILPIIESFETNETPDTEIWTTYGTPVFSAGMMNLPSTDYGTISGIQSVQAFNLQDGQFQFKLNAKPEGSPGGGLLDFGLRDANDSNFYVKGRLFRDNNGTGLELHYAHGGAEKTVYLASYLDTDVFYRLRYHEGFVFIEAAPMASGGQPGKFVFKGFEETAILPQVTNVKLFIDSNGQSIDGFWSIDGINVA